MEGRQLHHLVLLIWMSTWIASAIGSGLRCYCNLPRCIPVGYMCKTASPQGKCFYTLENSRVSDQGCTDLLPDLLPERITTNSHHHYCDYLQSRESFSRLVTKVRQSQSSRRRIVGCCESHMCNHVEYTDPLEKRLRSTLLALNASSSSSSSSSSAASDLSKSGAGPGPDTRFLRPLNRNSPLWRYTGGQSSSSAAFAEQEMWFKAAVIAVPIAGGFIMLVLVFIAFRLLRQDAYLRRKYSQHFPTADPGTAQLLYANGVYSGGGLGHESWPTVGGFSPDDPKQRTVV